MAVEEPGGRARFGELLAVGEFRALWLAQIGSVLGDQLARVALTILVYGRTHSALLAAVTFAASVIPDFVGGVFLAGLADRYPRRRVMIACDVIRMALVLAMLVPHLPIALLVALLFAVTTAGSPFTSARAALYSEVLHGELFVLGTAVTLTTYQFAQVLGLALGGAVVTLAGVHVALIVDAGTFAISALLTRLWVRQRPAARSADAAPSSRGADLLGGIRLVFGDPQLRTPMLLGWLAAFYNAPEAIATPLAAGLGAGAIGVGLILASLAFGASIGAIAFGRLASQATRLAWMRPLAVASCATLIAFAFQPNFQLVLVILFVAGLCDCYQIVAVTLFVRATPHSRRSQAFGLAQAGMSLGQGSAMIVAGAAAQRYAPATVVAVAGALGAIAAILISARRLPGRGPER
ncbi:MAG TPA: MFS transporter [Streptosporangiaceae bacterium]|nr:MFS transporter [Streptosporangiaceae bacterium]